MTRCFFVSDLHGRIDRYHKLFDQIRAEPPDVLFIGGDILPHALTTLAGDRSCDDFIEDFLLPGFLSLQGNLKVSYPTVFMILGNDDGQGEEDRILDGDRQGLWKYINNVRISLAGFDIFGYCYIPPSPFMLKDFERYDVSRYIGPGSVSPEEGFRSFPVSEHVARYSTIQDDLNALTENCNLDRAVFLFHTPPHETKLDRIASDGKIVDYVPLDRHVGSIAIRRLIEERQPYLTLHGHIHESAGIMGTWRDLIGKTHCFSAAHDGPELALIRFDLENPAGAVRELI
jgi:Icc-related predicted phosphoesterase